MSSIGRPGCQVHRRPAIRQARAGPAQHRAHHVRQVGQPAVNVSGPDSSRVMSSRLPMKRFSRSASSWMVRSMAARPASSSAPCRLVRLVAAPRMEASGVRRSCEMEVSRAERSRSVSACRRAWSTSRTRFTRSTASAAWSDRAFSRRCPSGVSSGPGSSRSMPNTPVGPRPVCMGRNSRLPPGRVSAPRPAGRLCSHAQSAAARSASSSVSSGGKPGLHGQAVRARQQHHHPHLQHQRHLVHGRPQHVVQRHRAGQLAAELVQLLRGLGARTGRHRLRSHAGGQVAGDDGDDGEHRQGDDVLRVGDGEGVERRQEEEVVGEHAQQAGQQRCRQAIRDGAGQHAHQQHQRHAGHAQHLSQQQRHAQRGRHREHAAAHALGAGSARNGRARRAASLARPAAPRPGRGRGCRRRG